MKTLPCFIFYCSSSRYLGDIWIYLWRIQCDLQYFLLIDCISSTEVEAWKNPLNSSETSWSVDKMSSPMLLVIFTGLRPFSENKGLAYVEILQLRVKFQTAMVSYLRLIRVTNSSDQIQRVWTANFLYTK